MRGGLLGDIFQYLFLLCFVVRSRRALGRGGTSSSTSLLRTRSPTSTAFLTSTGPPEFPSLPSTKHTACLSGATTSGRSSCSWANSERLFQGSR